MLDGLAGQGSAVFSFWPSLASWVSRVREAIDATYTIYPFMAYGTDWLAFGHMAIAIVFLGSVRDPGKNSWVIDAGIILCIVLVPYALLLGPIRGIPPFWTAVDCAFGVFGILPLLVARRWIKELTTSNPQRFREA